MERCFSVCLFRDARHSDKINLSLVYVMCVCGVGYKFKISDEEIVCLGRLCLDRVNFIFYICNTFC